MPNTKRLARLLKSALSLSLVMIFILAAGSYLLASPPQQDSPAAARGVGSGLHFSSPFLNVGLSPQFPNGGSTPSDPNGFDIGDACQSSRLTRYLTALDGVTPYVFSSTDVESLGLSLDPSGRLSGTFTSAAMPASFNVTVTDAAGASRTGVFFLQTNNCNGFHFAMDTLPLARVGQDYVCALGTIGGNGLPVFSVANASVQLNGSTVSNLETLGLRLFPDGTLAGRPLSSGSITFIAQAVENDMHAMNRLQTASDQTFTINVSDVSSVQSVLATSFALVKLGQASHDSLTIRAFVNANGVSNSSFAGKPFVLRLGSTTLEATLDATGHTHSPNMRVSINAQIGQLSIQLKNQSFSQLFDGASLPDGSIQQAVIQMGIGATYIGTEVYQFAVKNRNNRIQLSYSLGRGTEMGGLFQIISLIGTNDVTGQTSFQTRFLFSPVQPNANSSFGLAQQATVNIGPGFSQTIPLTNGSGSFPSGGLQSVVLSPKFKVGMISTFSLPQSATGIAPASTGQNQAFLLGVNLQTNTMVFSGAASMQISPFVTFNTFVPVFFDPFFPDDGGDFIEFQLKKLRLAKHVLHGGKRS